MDNSGAHRTLNIPSQAAITALWCSYRATESIGDKEYTIYEAGDQHVRDIAERDYRRYTRFVRWLAAWRPARPPKILELGANPYLLTTYLAQVLQCEITTAGYPDMGIRGTNERVGKIRVCDHHERPVFTAPLILFDVDAEPFPFDAATFDAVICGELIEHLINGPAHMLTEIHRVLRPGGLLLLSTPSAVSMAAGVAWLQNRNTNWPYSIQGIHARHNREYTMPELEDVLRVAGFATRARAYQVTEHPHGIYRAGFLGILKHWVMRTIYDLPTLPIPYLQQKADSLLLMAVRESSGTQAWPRSIYGGADSIPWIGPVSPQR